MCIKQYRSPKSILKKKISLVTQCNTSMDNYYENIDIVSSFFHLVMCYETKITNHQNLFNLILLNDDQFKFMKIIVLGIVRSRVSVFNFYL